MLVAQLDEKMRHGPDRSPFRPSEVEYRDEPSRAVPGLVYRWGGWFTRDVIPGGYVSAVVGVRGGRAQAIRGISDWWSLAGPWSPDSASQALRACHELVRLLHGGPFAFHPAIRTEDPEAFDRWVKVEPAEFVRRVSTPDMVEGPSDGKDRWRVSIWTVDSGDAIQRTCRFPATANRDVPPEVAATDSLKRPMGMIIL